MYDETDVGALAVLGAPEDEMDLRVKAAGVHYQNLMDRDINPLIVAPDAEAKMLREYFNDERLEDYEVVATKGKENRWDELAELGSVLEGDEEVHFFTSDYVLSQDTIAVRNEFPDIHAQFFGIETEKEHKKINSAVRNLRARAKYLDFSSLY